MSEFLVNTDPEVAWMENRTGVHDVKDIRLWTAKDPDRVYFDFTSDKGRNLTGGFSLDVEAMDEVARRWLESRNFFVMKE
jgi:hypothetical protein